MTEEFWVERGEIHSLNKFPCRSDKGYFLKRVINGHSDFNALFGEGGCEGI